MSFVWPTTRKPHTCASSSRSSCRFWCCTSCRTRSKGSRSIAHMASDALENLPYAAAERGSRRTSVETAFDHESACRGDTRQAAPIHAPTDADEQPETEGPQGDVPPHT